MTSLETEVAADGGSGTAPTAADAEAEAPPAPSDEAIAAVPAATPVERGRFVLHLHDRDEDSDDDDASKEEEDAVGGGDDDDDGSASADSPKSFDTDEVFDDVEQQEGEPIIDADSDLERLLGPLPRRASGGENVQSLEVESDGSDGSRRKRAKRPGLCPCCPKAVRRGPCRLLASVTGGDGLPQIRVGNMIMVFPKCFQKKGFGIIGPHWFGPVACLFLLTIATAHFAPKAYHNIGPISAITCLLFYTTGVVSLFIVSCSDPGIVKPGAGSDKYASVPTADVTAGRGWRYCDLCSVYQPPDAVHCPECNVCIEGYDHHCPWMGTCIGKKNFTSFMAFNLTWLVYLLYAIIWVTLVGTAFFAEATVRSSDSSVSSGDE